MENLIVFLYVITYGIVYIFNIPGSDEIISISSVFSLVILLVSTYGLIKNKKVKDFFQSNKKLNLIIIVYSVYKIVLTLFIDASLMYYTLTKVIPIVTFPILMYAFKNSNVLTEKIIKLLKAIMITTILVSLVVYVINIDTIQLSAREILKVISGKENLELYGERRFSLFFTHKSRFATYMIIVYMFLDQFKLEKKYKIVLIALSCLLIVFSSSITLLAIYLSIIFIDEIYEKREFIKKYLTKRAKYSLFILGIILVLVFVKKLSGRTGVFSLGYRIPIWIGGIKYFLRSPIGVIKQVEFYDIRTGVNEGFNAFHSHNVFIQEMIEYGIPSLIMIIAIMIIIGVMIYKHNKKMLVAYIGILIAFNFDLTTDMEFINMFWYSLPVLLTTKKYKLGESK